MDFQLTSGSCEQLQVTAPDDSPLARAPHILQVLALKNLGNPGRSRFRMILSDGVHFIQSLLTYALNPVVESGHIARNTIIIVSSVDLPRVSVPGHPVRRCVLVLCTGIFAHVIDCSQSRYYHWCASSVSGTP
jgi:replication factor A1